MDSREVSFWVEARRYDALQCTLEALGSDVESELRNHLDKRYEELVPDVERQRISEEITEEDRAAQIEYEANRRFSVARVTEHGQTNIYLCERGEDMISTALRLRRYLRNENQGKDIYAGETPLTAPEMEQYMAEAVCKSPRVVGAYDIDLDAGEISALNKITGWTTYQIKDISTAAYFATKKDSDSWVAKSKRFHDRLETLMPIDTQRPVMIRGDRPLPVDSIRIDGEVCEVGHLVTFYLPTDFDVDAVFGTNVNTNERGDWVNVYASYDMKQGCVCDRLEITLVRGDGTEIACQYSLTPEERASLLPKMDEYSRLVDGVSLEQSRRYYLAQEQEAAPQTAPAQQTPHEPTLQM